MIDGMSDRLEQLTRFFEADPNDAFTAYAIALEHHKAGQTDEALAWLDRTLALDADFAYAYFQKAKMLTGRGETDAAKTELQTGIAAADRANDEKARRELTELLNTLG